MIRKWSKYDIEFLRENASLLTHKQIAGELDRTVNAVRTKCCELGLVDRDNLWTQEELELLKDYYLKAGETAPINLNKLAEILGKNKTNICRKAKVLGLPTSIKRQQAVNSTLKQGYSRGKQGRREDLNNMYFRSSWEANYARYLNSLLNRGSIYKWEFEPDTFWFENIKRGVRSYLPDFKIWETQSSEPYYVEVKGWMDDKSRTKLKRMAKYYPKIKIELVQRREYNELKKLNIPNWE